MDNFLKQGKVNPERLKYLGNFVKATKKYDIICLDVLGDNPNPLYVGLFAQNFFSGYDEDLETFLRNQEMENIMPQTWKEHAKYTNRSNVRDAVWNMELLSYLLNYPVYTERIKDKVRVAERSTLDPIELIAYTVYPVSILGVTYSLLYRSISSIPILGLSLFVGSVFFVPHMLTKYSYKQVSRKPIPKMES